MAVQNSDAVAIRVLAQPVSSIAEQRVSKATWRLIITAPVAIVITAPVAGVLLPLPPLEGRDGVHEAHEKPEQ